MGIYKPSGGKFDIYGPYGVLYNDFKKCDMLLNINTKEEQLFKSVIELVEKANKNGILLKDLWQDVSKTDFLREFN